MVGYNIHTPHNLAINRRCLLIVTSSFLSGSHIALGSHTNVNILIRDSLATFVLVSYFIVFKCFESSIVVKAFEHAQNLKLPATWYLISMESAWDLIPHARCYTLFSIVTQLEMMPHMALSKLLFLYHQNWQITSFGLICFTATSSNSSMLKCTSNMVVST